MDNLISSIKEKYVFGDKLSTIKPLLEDYKSTDWVKWSNFSHLNYKRNLVYRDDKIEILLLCWNPEQQTSVHDHSHNGCIVKLLEGELIETIFSQKQIQSHKLLQDDITYLDNSIGVHKIENGRLYSVSLHIYSPPNYICKKIE